ncbi:MAG: hypothetical protein LRZ84_07315 [Desertifilum sp.]|nr:hypothetical protein [Desertifilum sp.]
MQSRLLSLVGAISKHFSTIVLLIFVSLSGVFLGVTPSAIAASQSSTTMTAPPQSTQSREDAYEKAAKAASSPEAQEEAYEEDLEKYKAENPDAKTGIVEEAKELVEKGVIDK